MKYTTLGRTGVTVSRLCLGCMSYGTPEWRPWILDEKAAQPFFRRAIEAGVNFFDTADMYGPFENERLLGKAIGDRRDQVVIATKFGNMRGDDGAFLGVNGSPDYVQKSCDASLQRLGIDVIDLYYQHRVDAKVPIEDTIGAMAALVQQGKVLHLGMSEASPATIRRAAAVHPIAALQTEYSLWSRDPEGEILPTCRELGIGFVAYSPLGRGFLTGRFQSPADLPADDWRHNNPRFQGDNFTRNLELVAKVQAVAARKGCTPAQLALAWVLRQGDDIAAIPGSKRRDRMEENAGAAAVVITDAELTEINALFPAGAAAGTRYTEAGMKTVNG